MTNKNVSVINIKPLNLITIDMTARVNNYLYTEREDIYREISANGQTPLDLIIEVIQNYWGTREVFIERLEGLNESNLYYAEEQAVGGDKYKVVDYLVLEHFWFLAASEAMEGGVLDGVIVDLNGEKIIKKPGKIWDYLQTYVSRDELKEYEVNKDYKLLINDKNENTKNIFSFNSILNQYYHALRVTKQEVGKGKLDDSSVIISYVLPEVGVLGADFVPMRVLTPENLEIAYQTEYDTDLGTTFSDNFMLASESELEEYTIQNSNYVVFEGYLKSLITSSDLSILNTVYYLWYITNNF